jgi:multicomponent Na+:H+ antiporter subunit B
VRYLYLRFAWLPLVAAAAILFYAARDLPTMGDPNTPAAEHISPRYIEHAQDETGASNMVTAVLADYRSFDTLGEVVVIFTAGLACLLVLGGFGRFEADSDSSDAMAYSFGSDVLDATSRLLFPFITLFAIYVVVHGHTSPGGGFQGGAIFAAAIILIRLLRGSSPELQLSSATTLAIASLGVLVFFSTGLLSIFFGKNFLDYSGLPLGYEGAHLREIGSLTIETGVFVAVTAVLVLIFQVLSAGDGDRS